MEKSKKMIRNAIIFIALIIITFYIILKDQNMEELFQILCNVKIQYVFLGIICMFIYLVLESVNLGRTLKVLKEKSSIFKNLKYAFIGFFFSSVTPAASGGQPMQIYYMYKDDISVANSTLALLMNLCSFQIISISFSFISLAINYNNISVALKLLFALGVTLNSIALALLLIGIFSKRLSAALVIFTLKIMKFFRVKNIEAKKENLEKTLGKYHGSAKYIKENKGLMVKMLITSAIQTLIYYSIPYWVYKSFGLSEYNIFNIITLQAVLYATVSGVPSPGAVGVSEGGFLGIFKNAFSQNIINGAMILNRGISFYLYVLISGIVVIISSLIARKKIKKEEET